MRTRIIILSAFAFMFWLSSAQGAGPRLFHGRVVDSKTGRPLANVRVRLFEHVDLIVAGLRAIPTAGSSISTPRKPKAYVPPAATATTDSKGSFVLKGRKMGNGEILCDRPGLSGGMQFGDVAPNKFLEIRYDAAAPALPVSRTLPKSRAVGSARR